VGTTFPLRAQAHQGSQQGLRGHRQIEATVYLWRRKCPEFKALWDEVVETLTDVAESTWYDRMVNGVQEDVFHGEKRIGTKTIYFPVFAMFWLKAHRKKYRFDEDGDDGVDPEEVAASLYRLLQEADASIPTEPPAAPPPEAAA